MALWKASGGKFKLYFRPWHGGRQGGNLKSWNLGQALWKARGELKSSILDHAIVEGKSGTINKELDSRSWHCGRQGRGKFIKSQILDQSFKIKSWILDHGIVEGKGGKCK